MSNAMEVADFINAVEQAQKVWDSWTPIDAEHIYSEVARNAIEGPLGLTPDVLVRSMNTAVGVAGATTMSILARNLWDSGRYRNTEGSEHADANLDYSASTAMVELSTTLLTHAAKTIEDVLSTTIQINVSAEQLAKMNGESNA